MNDHENDKDDCKHERQIGYYVICKSFLSSQAKQ